jgi:uncharacterized lipoprotein YehR (DUF1307 family)
MKKYVKIMPLVALFMAFTVNADIELNNNSEILGKWNVHHEATSMTAPKKETFTVWDIKDDGTVLAKSTDKSGRVNDTEISFKYSVKDGKFVKQVAPGREKYETCSVVEKEGDNMILHCTFFLFLTKQK